MKIYIDENLSPYIARALNLLEKRERIGNRCEVMSIQDALQKGIKDVELIPQFGKENAIWITQDKRILKNRAELKLILSHNIGLIILNPYWSKKKHWDKVVVIFSNWEKIKDLAISEKRPFAYTINGNSKLTKVDKIK